MSSVEGHSRAMLEMGTGTDLHGGDYTKAACRAVRDALQHSSLSFVSALGVDADSMPVVVTIGVTQPDAVDASQVQACFPIGDVAVSVVHGGLDVEGARPADAAVIASAAIEVFIPTR